MRRFFRAFSRYRPRLLTLILLVVIAAPIVLANLSAERSLREADYFGFGHTSYGWPLIWRRFVVCMPSRPLTVDSYLSYSRLATNAAMWLLMLSVPTGACEWLLRNYPLRLRWDLRTMLAAVALIAMCLARFVAARDRAEAEDAIIGTIHNKTGTVWVERWGPEWLDLVGTDRFRRRVAGISFEFPFGLEEPERDKEVLKQITRLDGLRHLFLAIRDYPPELGLADALNAMPRLRSLCISRVSSAELAVIGKMNALEHLSLGCPIDADFCACLEKLPNLKGLVLPSGEIDADLCACLEKLPNLKYLVLPYNKSDEHTSHRFLAAAGKLKNLEALYVEGIGFRVRGSSLTCLSELTKLRRLSLCGVSVVDEEAEGGLLRGLPPLPRLEALDLYASDVSDSDLCHLARPPRLKSLSLFGTRVTNAGISQLTRLMTLEELAIANRMASPSGLAELSAIAHLRRLHIGGKSPVERGTSKVLLDDQFPCYVWTSELGAFRRAMHALRQARPGIRIEGAGFTLYENGENWFRDEFTGLGSGSLPDRRSSWRPMSDWPAMNPTEAAWFQARGGWARFDAAGWGMNGPKTTF